jgi:hypothetical protein
VGRINCEAKSSLKISGNIVSYSSENSRIKKRRVVDNDNSDTDVQRRKVFKVYDRGEFTTAKKLVHEMRDAAGYEESSRSSIEF